MNNLTSSKIFSLKRAKWDGNKLKLFNRLVPEKFNKLSKASNIDCILKRSNYSTGKKITICLTTILCT